MRPRKVLQRFLGWVPQNRRSRLLGARAAPPLIDPRPQGAEDGWRRVLAPPADDCFSLSPTVEEVSGIAPESEFVLVSKDPLDAAALAKRIRTEPALQLEVQPIASGRASARPGRNAEYRYSVPPKEPLAPGQVYRFTLLDSAGATPLRTWGFQPQR